MPEERQFHPVADIFPMMSEREFNDLVEDIDANGLREPIWLHRDGRIIDGRNRHRACMEILSAGGSQYAKHAEPVFRTYEGDDSGLVSFVVSLNLHRRHLNESQRAMVAARIANLGQGRPSEDAGAKDVNSHLFEVGSPPPEPPPVPGVTNATAAEMLNVSEWSVSKARRVQERGVPELVEKVETGEVSVSTAAAIAAAPEEEQREVIAADDEKEIIRRAKEIKQRRKLEARERTPEPVDEPIPPPDGKYQCIVIDPPWPMQKIERDERPNQGRTLDYPVMSLEDIADERHVPVRTLAADDCHIYLWVTHKFLPAGLNLLEEWGFRYQCVMTWRKNVGITPFSWMYDTEHVLFGRKGNLKLQQLGLRLSFEAPVRGHSVKPDVFYERVIQASPGPRVEMFSRTVREGFVPWGNEVAANVV